MMKGGQILDVLKPRPTGLVNSFDIENEKM